MRYLLEPDTRTTPDEQLLADLRRVAGHRAPANLTYHLYNQHGRFSSATLSRRFGGWNRALLRAGMPIARRYRIPDDEVFAHLQTMWRTLGRQPRLSDFDRLSTAISPSLYIKRFGNWSAALRAFVGWANARPAIGKGAELSERASLDAKISPHAAASILPRPQSQCLPPRRGSRTPCPRLRYRVLCRDQFRCVQCGRSPATEAGVLLHIDHIVPWSTGGQTVLGNLQTLCKKCNLGKGNLPAGVPLPATGPLV